MKVTCLIITHYIYSTHIKKYYITFCRKKCIVTLLYVLYLCLDLEETAAGSRTDSNVGVYLAFIVAGFIMLIAATLLIMIIIHAAITMRRKKSAGQSLQAAMAVPQQVPTVRYSTCPLVSQARQISRGEINNHIT